jgi:hypothetical protein
MVYKRLKEISSFGNRWKFSNLAGSSDAGPTKVSSFSVIQGYVWRLPLKFFEFHHESLIKFVKDDKIVLATYLENNKGLNNKIKRL